MTLNWENLFCFLDTIQFYLSGLTDRFLNARAQGTMSSTLQDLGGYEMVNRTSFEKGKRQPGELKTTKAGLLGGDTPVIYSKL